MPPDGNGLPPDGKGLPPDGNGLPPGSNSLPPDGDGSSPAGNGLPPDGVGLPPDGVGLPPDGNRLLPSGNGSPPGSAESCAARLVRFPSRSSRPVEREDEDGAAGVRAAVRAEARERPPMGAYAPLSATDAAPSGVAATSAVACGRPDQAAGARRNDA